MIEVTNRIAIIGAGSVGASIAYAVILRHVCSEVVLVDVDEQVCRAQVLDLEDGQFLTNCQVRYGTPKDAGQCDFIVITAGAKQRDGETRVQLIDRNFNILNAVIGGMKPLKPSAVLLVVSNPCDILTYFAQKLSGLPVNQVFGSGTFLDTARLRGAIAKKIDVTDTAVHAYVLGT
jgi:L-lactate dehydrogenase